MKIYVFEAELTSVGLVSVRAHNPTEALIRLHAGEFEGPDNFDGPFCVAPKARAELVSEDDE